MGMLKRMAVYLFIILFLMSMYNDLTKGSILYEEVVPIDKQENSIVKIKARSGDTVLTMSERLYSSDSIRMEKIMEDFKKLNPHTNPYRLIADEYYYFPAKDTTLP
ncbi:hypothetical protein ACLIBH_13190 [Virgibacillus sp. W0430]|uniref:hypothetical protein n=1 Tax=Virgibacillus sp. W0430 TaxID=3391580 RepID=UPI003F460368